MELSDYLKDPGYAAMIGAGLTVLYIYAKARMNGEDMPKNSELLKPAVLNAVMVYFIVSGGLGARETISTEPF